MSLLVQKLQFDTELLKRGKAIHLQDISWSEWEKKKFPYNSKFKEINADGLLSSVLPLELEVFVCTKDGEMDMLTVPVDLVADKLLEITVLYGGERVE